jgi:glutamine amidotransferase
LIGIIDYGMGNLRSVANAIDAADGNWLVCSAPAELRKAKGIVLPGVGAFAEAMRRLQKLGWDEALERDVLDRGKPLLGICLGLQLLARQGTEEGLNEGFGWIPATVERLPRTAEHLRLPHIGWNDVKFSDAGNGLSKGLREEETFYFGHSFAVASDGQPFVKGVTRYGVEFVSCVEAENVWATQFHPEKSQKAGLQILQNFVRRSG